MATDESSAKHPPIPEISITTSTTNLDVVPECEPTGQLRIAVDDPLTPPHSLPSLSVSGDTPLTPHGQFHHTRSPSEPTADPTLLSPVLLPILRPSTPPPSSPSVSDQGSILLSNPPSPTLSSRSSVHFQQPTTTSLRDNNPGSGLTSLRMLSPDMAHRHRRRSSSVSHTTMDDGSTEATELDSSHNLPLTPVGSSSRSDGGSVNTSASPTVTAYETMSDQTYELKPNSMPQHDGPEPREGGDFTSHKGTKGKGTTKVIEKDPIPEDNADPSPFGFGPSRLASLVDPKNLDSLTELGGVDGLIKSLGTHLHHGLSSESLCQKIASSKTEHVVDDGGGGGGGDGEYGSSRKASSHPQDPFKTTFEDRKRVYGVNILPVRRSKSLLLLMWLALKDKVLVRVATKFNPITMASQKSYVLFRYFSLSQQ